MNPPGYIGQWGDWRYYKLENRNGTVLRINLTWEGADTDLDMYRLWAGRRESTVSPGRGIVRGNT